MGLKLSDGNCTHRRTIWVDEVVAVPGGKGETKAVKTKVCLDCGKPLEVRDAASS